MNGQTKTVSILGCGWLGLPLAEHLTRLSYWVKGSTTTAEKLDLLRNKRIEPFLINLADNSSLSHIPPFLNTDYLVISFPPRLRAGHADSYLSQIKTLVNALSRASQLKQVLFISSTSVYRDSNQVITDTNEPDAMNADSPLLQAESMLQQATAYRTIILRLGGLVGGTRHPGRFLAGKTEVPQPSAPVNLIHLDDCICLCTAIITDPGGSEIYHACADLHPSRQELYTAAARALHLPPPQFKQPEPPVYKIINSQKIKKAYDYQFIHPDPMFFF